MQSVKPIIFLIKEEVTDPNDIFKDLEALEIAESDDKFLYYKKSYPHPPDWDGFVRKYFEVGQEVFRNSSSYAVLVLKLEDRFFAIPFGMGSHLINLAKIEYNFGLKIAINNIPKSDLRQIDTTTPEASSQKTRKQAVKKSTPEDFGVNKHKDILRGIVGELPKDHQFGKTLQGKDSVKLSKNVEDIEELEELCRQLLASSKAEDYKQDYPWIDNMAIENDPIMVDKLFDDLIAKIRDNDFEDMYIAQPEFVENLYEYVGFVFSGDRKRKSNKTPYQFPTMAEFCEDFEAEFIANLTRDSLSNTCRVYLKTTDGEFRFGWPLSRCIVWETEYNQKKYILSEGEWYKVETKFYDEVRDFFNEKVSDLSLPAYTSEHVKEADYNAHVCQALKDAYLFDLGHTDAKGRSITRDGNEICDIFEAGNKRFIHVKSGKSSPDISHLLRQGIFSGQALKRDADAFQTFQKHLSDAGCPADLVPTKHNPSDYKVAFGILLKKNQRTDIPFFSKLSFKDAAEFTLGEMGYECEIGFLVEEDQEHPSDEAPEQAIEYCEEVLV